MTNPAAGVFKQLVYKAESTYGTIPAAGSAQYLRRVQSSLDLMKDTYQSNEIRTDQQVYDFRHGVRRVQGKITGELSCTTYSDFLAAALRKAWATTAAITGASITISGSGPYTIARAAGSFLTDGVKVGDVVRLTAGSFTAGNLNKNLVVTAVVALELTVVVLNSSTLTAEGPIASATVTIQGKRVWTPQTGHTDNSFSIEHHYSDLDQSEVFSGCKPTKISIGLPPTGLATIDMDMMGQNVTTYSAGNAPYFTSPTAATATGLMQSVNGVLRMGGAAVANITGLTIDIASNYSGDPVVGATTVPFLFAGRILVTGQLTAYFDSVTLRDAFLNETEIDMIAVFSASNDANAAFLSFVCPRIKVGGSSKNDGEGGLVQTIPFQALLDGTGGSGADTEITTLVIQDSTLT